MKKILLLTLTTFFLCIAGCNSDSKLKTWSPEQENKWKSECKEMLMGGGTEGSIAEDRCDCVFKKTAEKYTPEEAAALTEDQERKILEECDYSW